MQCLLALTVHSRLLFITGSRSAYLLGLISNHHDSTAFSQRSLTKRLTAEKVYLYPLLISDDSVLVSGGSSFRAALANLSAASFPLIPVWPGIHRVSTAGCTRVWAMYFSTIAWEDLDLPLWRARTTVELSKSTLMGLLPAIRMAASRDFWAPNISASYISAPGIAPTPCPINRTSLYKTYPHANLAGPHDDPSEYAKIVSDGKLSNQYFTRAFLSCLLPPIDRILGSPRGKKRCPGPSADGILLALICNRVR